MKKLLERWAELDPERVQIIPDEDGNLLRGIVRLTRHGIPIKTSEDRAYDQDFEDVILGAALEAVDDRSLQWQLTCVVDNRTQDDLIYRAVIQGGAEKTSIRSPALALLEAYISVLESQKEKLAIVE